MRFNLDHATLSVAPAIPLNVNDASGRTLRVIQGRVWITQEGSLDDAFLGAGETFRFDSGGSAVLTAENPDGSSSAVMFDIPLSIQSRAAGSSNWFALLRQSWSSAVAN